MRKKCLFYGNCQAEALIFHISKNLEFQESYEIVNIKPVHLLNQDDVGTLYDVVGKTDVFIHQPISENYKNLNSLGTELLINKTKIGCKIISFPVAFLKIYNPEMCYLNNKLGFNVPRNYPYYDSNIIKLILDEKSESEIYNNIFMEDFYTKHVSQNFFLKNITELKSREAKLDIKIVDYIIANYKTQKLFHTFNHPNAGLICYIANEILKKLEIDQPIPFVMNKTKDTLKRNSFPIYPSTMKNMELEFENQNHYLFANEIVPIKTYILELKRFILQNYSLLNLSSIIN